MTNLLQWGSFTSAAGLPLAWKIECDAFTKEDWDCIARVMAPHLGPFGACFGVPRGGFAMAEAFKPFVSADWGAPVLLVDDVWTTGKSMNAFANEYLVRGTTWIGCVVFTRNPIAVPNVRAMFTLNFK